MALGSPEEGTGQLPGLEPIGLIDPESEDADEQSLMDENTEFINLENEEMENHVAEGTNVVSGAEASDLSCPELTEVSDDDKNLTPATQSEEEVGKDSGQSNTPEPQHSEKSLTDHETRPDSVEKGQIMSAIKASRDEKDQTERETDPTMTDEEINPTLRALEESCQGLVKPIKHMVGLSEEKQEQVPKRRSRYLDGRGQEGNDLSQTPQMTMIRMLDELSLSMSREQEKDVLKVMKHLLEQDWEQSDGGEGRSRHADRGTDETRECRPCRKAEGPRRTGTRQGSRVHVTEEAPWRNGSTDSKPSKRFRAKASRGPEQARSQEEPCACVALGRTGPAPRVPEEPRRVRARDYRQNGGSLFPQDEHYGGQEMRTRAEPRGGARPKTVRYREEHAQLEEERRRSRKAQTQKGPRSPEEELQAGYVHRTSGRRDHGERASGLTANKAQAQRPRRDRRGTKGQSCELQGVSAVRTEERAPLDKNDPARKSAGQRRVTDLQERKRVKVHKRPPADLPAREWSQTQRRRFEDMMRSWAQERSPRTRGGRSQHDIDWNDMVEDEEDDLDENVRRIAQPSYNNVHVNGIMQNPKTKATTKLKMVIDQGQTIRQGVLISEQLVKKLNLPYAKLLPGKQVGTAKGSARLEKVGITEPVNIKIPGISKVFSSKAVVCKDVADECNLGTAFLQNIHKVTGLKPKLEFCAGGTRLTLGNDQVELVRRVESDPAKDKKGAREENQPLEIPVIVQKDTVMSGNSLNFVEVEQVPAAALLEPIDQPGLGAVQAVPGVYQQQSKVAVLNLEEERVLRAGTQIAKLIPTKHILNKVEGERVRVAKEDPGRVEELWKELRLEENEMLKKEPELKEKLKELIKEYSDIFSSPEQSFGKTSLIEFEIRLEPGTKPVKTKLRPINPKQRASLKEQIDKWVAEDVVEECESPWASALVPVLKKDGSTRWAVDYRPLNKATIKDSYPLPSISENLEKLQGSQVFSTLDAAGAYHCVPVEASSRPLLAFITPFGLYTFKRMPFGASNSGPCYARFMEMLVSKLKSPWTLCYLDDMMVHTLTMAQHLEELRKVFQMHREAGIRLKAKKTELFEKQACYLGYRITQDGVCMRDDYVEKILQWPTPKSVKELSSFLGVVGYYRSFIPQFAALTHQMNAQKKQKELQWNEELQQKFEHLKKLFGEKPIRAYPDYDGEMFEVWPDFSSMAFGGVLQQVQHGQRRFIAASGRKTTAGEKNYAPTKGELASIIHILRKHEHLLRYKKFRIYSDHQPLKWLRSMKNPKGIYWRWLNELESYDYEIVHVAGKKTGAADGLSRSTHLPDPTKEEEEEAEEFVFRTDEAEEANLVKLDRGTLKEAQEQDEVLRVVRKWVKGNPPKNKEEIRGLPHDAHVYHQHLDVLEVDEGGLLVLKKSPGFSKDRQRILIPDKETLRREIFRFSHRHPTAGHFGTQATCARAALKFYWPGMNTDLKRRVKSCDACLAKIQQVDLKGGVHKPRSHGFPGEVLYLDLVGPMPETDKGDKYIMTMQDGFSRYCTAATIPNKEAATVANALLDAWVTKHGCPVRIHTDQGREWHNAIWHQLCERLQIAKTVTPAYNPQSNLVERFHRTLNTIMRTHLAREDAGWARFLPMATFAFNTKVNASTGVTPFEAWMGRPAKLPIDLVIPTPDQQWVNTDAYIQETLMRFREMYAFMQKHTEATFRRNAKLYAGKANVYQVDDLIWVFSKRKVPGKPNKITDGWTGPYRVVAKPAEVLLEVTPAGVEGRTFTIHVARAAPVRGELREGRQPTDGTQATEEETDELAEELCLPARWLEPLDNLAIPVKTAPEPPRMVELAQRRAIGPTHVVADPGQAVGAGQGGPQSMEGNLTVHTNPSTSSSVTHDDKPGDERQPETRRVHFQGEKRAHEGHGGAENNKLQRRKAEKREHQADKERGASRPKHKVRWRDLVRDSESESGASDREVQLPTEEEVAYSSDEEVKTLTEGMPELGGCVNVDIAPLSQLPVQAAAGAAGWHCRANQSLTIGPRQAKKVDLGLHMALPPGFSALLLSRARLASEGVTVEGGLIDSGCRGPITCVLHNNTNVSRRIQKGEKICQLVILSTPTVKWQTVHQSDGAKNTTEWN